MNHEPESRARYVTAGGRKDVAAVAPADHHAGQSAGRTERAQSQESRGLAHRGFAPGQSRGTNREVLDSI
jgi:hypothetical protein